MIRRVPVVATLLVAAAIAAMIALGLWQLRRAEWKEQLLARYAAAESLSSAVPFPRTEAAAEPVLYRHSDATCTTVRSIDPVAGRNAQGTSGWAQVARCLQPDGAEVRVVLGWSERPQAVAWSGAPLAIGVIAPGPRLVAHPPLAGLQANARPDPSDLPNNHRSYAGQWFLFAATAAIIYGLALRLRMRRKG